MTTTQIIAAHLAARDRMDAARAEYDRRLRIPVIGGLYAIPARRRYQEAVRAYAIAAQARRVACLADLRLGTVTLRGRAEHLAARRGVRYVIAPEVIFHQPGLGRA